MKRTSSLTSIILAALLIFLSQSFSCFADEDESAKSFLSIFKPVDCTESEIEIFSDIGRLDKTDSEIQEGLWRFDIAQDGTLAVVYGDADVNEILCIYDKDMNELYRYRIHSVFGIKLHDKMIFVFTRDDICRVYNLDGQLIAAYKLTAVEEHNFSSNEYIAYDKMIFANERKIGQNRYYFTDYLKGKPKELNYHGIYSKLIKEDSQGTKTVLIYRNNTLVMLIIFVPCTLILLLLGLAVVIEQMRKTNSNKK